MLQTEPAACQVGEDAGGQRDPRTVSSTGSPKTPVSRAWPCITHILVGAAGIQQLDTHTHYVTEHTQASQGHGIQRDAGGRGCLRQGSRRGHSEEVLEL